MQKELNREFTETLLLLIVGSVGLYAIGRAERVGLSGALGASFTWRAHPCGKGASGPIVGWPAST